jgi:hypothetical protein
MLYWTPVAKGDTVTVEDLPLSVLLAAILELVSKKSHLLPTKINSKPW